MASAVVFCYLRNSETLNLTPIPSEAQTSVKMHSSPNKRFKAIFSLLLLASIGLETGMANVVLLRGSIVDDNGLNFAEGDATRFSQNVNGRTYQRPPLTTFQGYQYVTYYDDNRNVCLGRRQLPGGEWEIIRFTDYAMPGSDSHNVVTLGICAADGTIHLMFDHHADPLNYRVSAQNVATHPETAEWSANLFGPISDQLGSVGGFERFTYPYFFPAPNGNLMLFFRDGGSGNGNGMIHEYDGTAHDWIPGLGKFIASTGSYTGILSNNSQSRNPYLNAIAYSGDRIHVSWGWRESSGGSQFNHDLCYAYSDDDGRSWHNNEGDLIGVTGSSFIDVNSPGLVVASIPQDQGLSNQYTHYAYPDGTCHVMVSHNVEGTTNRSYHHYWRDASGNWDSAALSFSGSRPKMVGNDDGTLFLVYASGGRLRIAKGVPNSDKTQWDWSSVYTQSDSTEAGEGQIDYTRWEQDGVLSVYGQERPSSVLSYGSGTPINGLPSPVHVFDYQVSNAAIQPSPAPNSDRVNLDAAMEWTAGLDAISRHVYLGTNPDTVAAATPNSPEFKGEQDATTYQPPSDLYGLTDYYWRVDEVQSGGIVIPGRLWHFATRDEDPTVNPIAFGPKEDQLEFNYRRSKSELSEGATYTVEWSDSLQAGSWTSDGISENVQDDTGNIQTVNATIPLLLGERRFMKLTTTP